MILTEKEIDLLSVFTAGVMLGILIIVIAFLISKL
jgi:hypothetical protein|tara:strand:+ start:542 stop:646 length:105 start_codon:yes stop_codon:yes gene_type:complete